MQHFTRLPPAGEVFLDARSGARVLRVSWHSEAGVVVLSLWRGQTCAGSFRLAIEEVPALIEVLAHGLDVEYGEARGGHVHGGHVRGDLAG